MSDEDKGTFYKTDAENPAACPWTVTVRPLPFGYSITLTNGIKYDVAEGTATANSRRLDDTEKR
jgi:hypothetical protein